MWLYLEIIYGIFNITNIFWKNIGSTLKLYLKFLKLYVNTSQKNPLFLLSKKCMMVCFAGMSSKDVSELRCSADGFLEEPRTALPAVIDWDLKMVDLNDLKQLETVANDRKIIMWVLSKFLYAYSESCELTARLHRVHFVTMGYPVSIYINATWQSTSWQS